MDDGLTYITNAINALENKTILTTPSFHLSLTKFTLALPQHIFLIFHWSASYIALFSCILIGPQDSWLIIYSLLLIIIPSS